MDLVASGLSREQSVGVGPIVCIYSNTLLKCLFSFHFVKMEIVLIDGVKLQPQTGMNV